MAELVELICQAQDQIKLLNANIEAKKNEAKKAVEQAQSIRLSAGSLARSLPAATTQVIAAQIRNETCTCKNARMLLVNDFAVQYLKISKHGTLF